MEYKKKVTKIYIISHKYLVLAYNMNDSPTNLEQKQLLQFYPRGETIKNKAQSIFFFIQIPE